MFDPFDCSAQPIAYQWHRPELLTGSLFGSQRQLTKRVEDDQLARMVLTGETFRESLLLASHKRDEYFN